MKINKKVAKRGNTQRIQVTKTTTFIFNMEDFDLDENATFRNTENLVEALEGVVKQIGYSDLAGYLSEFEFGFLGDSEYDIELISEQKQQVL